MRTGQAIVCGWPGLLLLWRDGRPSGLLTALGFAAVWNGAVVATFVLPELVPVTLRIFLWVVVAVIWMVATWHAVRRVQAPASDAAVEAYQGLFLQAQAEYLKGHAFEAEALLLELLKHCPEDADARLLFAGLLRRAQRADEAVRQLRLLEKCSGAAKWELEIQRERALLQVRREPRGSDRRATGGRQAASGDDEITARAA